jgi:two-component system response regulator YesN
MKITILVADDEALERRALFQILSQIPNHEVKLIEAVNGRQAVEQALKENPQIALLDIRMPGMNGLRAAKILREKLPQLRIVFITAFDEFDYAREAIRLDVDEYLLKPAAPQEVQSTIQNLIEKIEEAQTQQRVLEEKNEQEELVYSLWEKDMRLLLSQGFAGRKDRFPLMTSPLRSTDFYYTVIFRTRGKFRKDPSLRRTHHGKIAPLVEKLYRDAHWYALSGYDETEVRCVVAPQDPIDHSDPEGIKQLTLHCVEGLQSSLGTRLVAGISDSFPWAAEALLLCGENRPVMVWISPSLENGDGANFSPPPPVERAIAYIKDHLTEDLSLTDVASAVGLSPSHVSRLFGRYGDSSFVHLCNRLRIEAAKGLLKMGTYSVKEVCSMVGYRDQGYFARVFRREEGCSPTEFTAK